MPLPYKSKTIRESLKFHDSAKWDAFVKRRLELIQSYKFLAKPLKDQDAEMTEAAKILCKEHGYPDRIDEFKKLLHIGIVSLRDKQKKLQRMAGTIKSVAVDESNIGTVSVYVIDTSQERSEEVSGTGFSGAADEKNVSKYPESLAGQQQFNGDHSANASASAHNSFYSGSIYGILAHAGRMDDGSNDSIQEFTPNTSTYSVLNSSSTSISSKTHQSFSPLTGYPYKVPDPRLILLHYIENCSCQENPLFTFLGESCLNSSIALSLLECDGTSTGLKLFKRKFTSMSYIAGFYRKLEPISSKNLEDFDVVDKFHTLLGNCVAIYGISEVIRALSHWFKAEIGQATSSRII